MHYGVSTRNHHRVRHNKAEDNIKIHTNILIILVFRCEKFDKTENSIFVPKSLQRMTYLAINNCFLFSIHHSLITFS